MKYASMMVAAYQNATGKTEDESLKDLSINNLMSKNNLEPLPDYDFLRTLSGDVNGIKAWANLKVIRN